MGQSFFGRPNEIIFKTYLIYKYPFESSFQNNLNFYDWVSNENFMAKILTGCQAGSLGTELGQSIFLMPYWTYFVNMFHWYILL